MSKTLQEILPVPQYTYIVCLATVNYLRVWCQNAGRYDRMVQAARLRFQSQASLAHNGGRCFTQKSRKEKNFLKKRRQNRAHV